METANTQPLQLFVQLSYKANQSFKNDITGNVIKFTQVTQTSYVIENTPKSRMAIQLVKERFGSNCIYITN